jgi:hypothetical protein
VYKNAFNVLLGEYMMIVDRDLLNPFSLLIMLAIGFFGSLLAWGFVEVVRRLKAGKVHLQSIIQKVAMRDSRDSTLLIFRLLFVILAFTLASFVIVFAEITRTSRYLYEIQENGTVLWLYKPEIYITVFLFILFFIAGMAFGAMVLHMIIFDRAFSLYKSRLKQKGEGDTDEKEKN